MTILLHTEKFFEEFTKSFGTSTFGNLFWYILLCVLAAILLFFVGKRLARQFLVDREGRHLFNELCLAHGLRPRERRFLWNYADALRLENHCMVFMQQSLFEREHSEIFKKRGLATHMCLRSGSHKAMRDNLKQILFADKHENHQLRRQTDIADKTT